MTEGGERRENARRKRTLLGRSAGRASAVNDDYCRASSIYSPTAFAIIGELPLVNCSRYAVCTGVLASKHHYYPDAGEQRERESGRTRSTIGNQFRSRGELPARETPR